MRRKKYDKLMRKSGLAWRVALSVVVGMGWLMFLIVWLFFYASNYTIYQNIAIFLLSILVMGAILGAPWAYWSIKWGHKFEEFKEYHKPKKRKK